jgi:hypothetical protein
MSPTFRNLLLTTSLAAVALGAVQFLAALPYQMHRVGLIAPVTWEQALVDLLETK